MIITVTIFIVEPFRSTLNDVFDGTMTGTSNGWIYYTTERFGNVVLLLPHVHANENSDRIRRQRLQYQPITEIKPMLL